MKLKKLDYFEAIEKSMENAKELIEESEILVANNKIARAYTLCQLAIEEIGKATLTFEFVLNGDIENITDTKNFMKKFRSHESKTKVSKGLDFMFALMTDKSEFTKKIMENSLLNMDNVKVKNTYKNYSLYTSLFENEFRKPTEIISKELQNNISDLAKLRFQIAEPFLKIGIQNFDILFETRNCIDKDEILKEGAEKIKALLKK